MTGGGFGGCTVTLVKKEAVNEVIETMKAGYSGKATFFVCEASEDWERRCLASGDLLSFILSLKSYCSHSYFRTSRTTPTGRDQFRCNI